MIRSLLRAPLLGLLVLRGLAAAPQSDAANAALLARMRTLYNAHRWEQLAEVPVAPDAPAEADYYRGLGLARLERWAEARQALLDGERKSPRNKRFPEELAGVAFKRGDLPEARRHLRRALELDPQDEYALDFLATVFELQGNLDAALKYWNRIGKPRIASLSFEPQPRLNPVLLDRAFAFAPTSVMRWPELLDTRARLDSLGVFSRYQIRLAPALDGGEGKLDAVFEADERHGWGNTKLQGLLWLLCGLPYDTVYPEWYNLRNSATNFTSLLRWDPQKRRAMFTLSGPWASSARWRYEMHMDGRDEVWSVSPDFYGPGPALNHLELDSLRAGADLRFIADGRWSFDTGVEGSQRHFDNLPAAFPSSTGANPGASFFRSGFLLSDHIEVSHELLRVPERRFLIESSLRAEFGRLFARAEDPFAQVRASAAADWRPGPDGERNDFTLRVRGGKTLGDIPFDELFMLGVERDNDLWLRGHVGTSEGRKGSAPLGRDFILTNAGYSRLVWQNGVVKLNFGPFLDSGRISDPSGLFGSRAWLWDPGVQLKVTLLGGVEVRFSYGRDLRAGHHAFYVSASP